MSSSSRMEAVIDPSGPVIVGYVSLNASRHGGPWADFVTLPVPEGADQETIGVTYDSETQTYMFTTDAAKVQAKLDQAWTALRTERNRRLAETDWVALADAHLSQDKKDAWFAYRQELTDLPESITNPSDLVSVPWPLDPTQTPAVVPSSGSRLANLLGHADVPVEPVAEPVAESAPEVQELVAEPVVESAPEVQEPVAEPVVESAPEPVAP